MSKEYLEAFNIIKFNPDNVDGLQYLEAFKVIEQALKRLETMDNTNPSEALKKLEMLSDCAEAMKEAPSSNWIEYANSETELNYKLWRAYEDLKQYILKSQEQEKVLEIIKKKNINVFLLKRADDLFYYNANNGLRGYPIETQEEFDLLKRYYNEKK